MPSLVDDANIQVPLDEREFHVRRGGHEVLRARDLVRDEVRLKPRHKVVGVQVADRIEDPVVRANERVVRVVRAIVLEQTRWRFKLRHVTILTA